MSVEKALAGTLLETSGELPPFLSALLANAPDSFAEKVLGKTAVAIRALRDKGTPVHISTVRAELNGKLPEGGDLLLEELGAEALPLDLAEHEAETLWRDFYNRRVAATLCDASAALSAKPTEATSIAANVRATLEHLDGDRRPGRGLTLRHPSEFLAMTFADDDIILGDRLAALGQSLVFAGAGGLGKSRLILQWAACTVTGRKFLAFDTAGAHLRWLILQSENSNRRLHGDLARLQQWLGDDWQAFNERVIIHAIEGDDDSFLSLESPENVSRIEDAITKSKPDIIAADPLNDLAIGDLNKDADMRATLMTFTRVCRKGNPNRLIAAAHHALTGRAGAARATGFDRASFARNSKTLHAWARGQINLAPVDGDSNDRLIVACGKCSNGREFPAFGIRLNPETMVYECDPSIDVSEWEREMSGSARNGPLITPERVAELCHGPLRKAELARAIMYDCGCTRGSAYRYIARASSKLRFNKANECYTAR